MTTQHVSDGRGAEDAAVCLDISVGRHGFVTVDGTNYPNRTVSCAAVALAGIRNERGSYPRFLVIVDGAYVVANTVRQLERVLDTIRSGPCRVFRNAGKGSIVDFDTLEGAK